MFEPINPQSLDILCISTTGWDEIWGSRQQIMLRLAKAGHRVLFVERQIGLEHFLKNVEYRQAEIHPFSTIKPIAIGEKLWRWQPPMMIPGRYYSTSLNGIGQALLAKRIYKVLRQLDFRSPILWMYPPHSAPLIGAFNERLSIYHCIERFSGEQAGNKLRVMTRQEESLLSKADLVFVHAQGLKSLYEHLTQKPIIFIPSAADVGHFQSHSEIHPSMTAIPRPHLVVTGVLDSRLDYHLLELIAVSRPDWHLVLIGKLKNQHIIPASIQKLKNVHFMGNQPFDLLPSFLNGADVALIPYRITEMTRYINPLKAYEYMAAGIPTVSSELPELLPLSDWIYIVKTGDLDLTVYSENFIQTIASALSNETAQRQAGRRMVARSHNWDDRVAEMMEIIWQSL